MNLVRLAALEEVLHAQHQLTRTERFGKVILRAELEAEHTIHFGGLRGEHKHGQIGRGGIAAVEFANLQPIHARQHQIKHHGVRLLGLDAA